MGTSMAPSHEAVLFMAKVSFIDKAWSDKRKVPLQRETMSALSGAAKVYIYIYI